MKRKVDKADTHPSVCKREKGKEKKTQREQARKKKECLNVFVPLQETKSLKWCHCLHFDWQIVQCRCVQTSVWKTETREKSADSWWKNEEKIAYILLYLICEEKHKTPFPYCVNIFFCVGVGIVTVKDTRVVLPLLLHFMLHTPNK